MTRIPILTRIHVASDENSSRVAFVVCPEDGRFAPRETCRRCEKCVEVGDASIRCAVDCERRGASEPDEGSIVEALDASVLCVDGSVTVEAAARALEEGGVPVAVVLDENGHAVGIVTREELARRAPSRRVETCVSAFLIALLERATVDEAIELVTQRRVRYVPVLGAGRVVGIVTPESIIRWLAQNLRRARRLVAETGNER